MQAGAFFLCLKTQRLCFPKDHFLSKRIGHVSMFSQGMEFSQRDKLSKNIAMTAHVL